MNDSRTYFILGGTGGIGFEVVSHLANMGHKIAVFSRSSSDKLLKLANIKHYPADALEPGSLDQSIKSAAEELGPPHGMVNCIGSMLLKPAHLTSDEDWSKTLRLNLDTAFITTRAAGKLMAANGGSVVLMSTCAARIGLKNHEPIAAAKAGIEGLMRSAAATYAPKIRFNCVAPGLVKTPLAQPLLRSEASIQLSLALHPLKRFGEPNEVAQLILFLLSDAATWITGQVLGIDGGLSTLKA